jgi:lycopene cyclase domain-containing protein
MPGLYLLAILGAFAGVALLDHRFQLRLARPATLAAIVVVEIAFLAFDVLGASGGWFATNSNWVVASWPPGIPLEEPLLLAFITVWAIALYRLAGRWTGEDPS